MGLDLSELREPGRDRRAGAARGSAWPRDPDGAPLYPGRAQACRAAERTRRIDAGEPMRCASTCRRRSRAPARSPGPKPARAGGETGTVAADPAAWGDVVLARKDAPTSYHLAVVVDDAAQGVTDVVRGRDLFYATSVHRLLQALLGLPAPAYHHHRLILDADGRKLSKSTQATGLRELRAQGVTPAEIRRHGRARLSAASVACSSPGAGEWRRRKAQDNGRAAAANACAAQRRRPSARAVEAALAGIAHDIRTPLTGIVALAELLATSDLGERERGWASAIKSGAEHLAALTTLIVDAVKADAAGLVLRREPFSPRRLAQAVGVALAARAGEQGAQGARSRIADDLPACVTGDALRLRAALENLIDNAVKFTDAGTVVLHRRRQAGRARRVRLVFTVRDSGIGMAPPS